MKKITILLIMLLLVVSVKSQGSIATDCNESITITSPSFDKKLVSAWSVIDDISACEKLVHVSAWGTARIWLQKKQPNGTFIDVHGPILDRVPPTQSAQTTYGVGQIGNVSPGVYRGRIVVPALNIISCGPVVFHTASAINAGFRAIQSSSIFTDQIILGQATNDDITFSWLDNENIYGAYNLVNDENEIIVNTSGSRDHDAWKMYLFESGNWRNRYETPFIDGMIPQTFNVITDIFNNYSNVFTGGSWAGFEKFKNYKVHIGVVTDCGGWGAHEEQFFMCDIESPNNLDCRPRLAQQQDILIAPNPTNDFFRLVRNSGDNILPESTDILCIYDVSGRIVKEFNRDWMDEYQIPDLKPGIYFLRLMNSSNDQIFSGRMIKN